MVRCIYCSDRIWKVPARQRFQPRIWNVHLLFVFKNNYLAFFSENNEVTRALQRLKPRICPVLSEKKKVVDRHFHFSGQPRNRGDESPLQRVLLNRWSASVIFTPFFSSVYCTFFPSHELVIRLHDLIIPAHDLINTCSLTCYRVGHLTLLELHMILLYVCMISSFPAHDLFREEQSGFFAFEVY